MVRDHAGFFVIGDMEYLGLSFVVIGILCWLFVFPGGIFELAFYYRMNNRYFNFGPSTYKLDMNLKINPYHLYVLLADKVFPSWILKYSPKSRQIFARKSLYACWSLPRVTFNINYQKKELFITVRPYVSSFFMPM